jgi:hypothetical protein
MRTRKRKVKNKKTKMQKDDRIYYAGEMSLRRYAGLENKKIKTIKDLEDSIDAEAQFAFDELYRKLKGKI